MNSLIEKKVGYNIKLLRERAVILQEVRLPKLKWGRDIYIPMKLFC